MSFVVVIQCGRNLNMNTNLLQDAFCQKVHEVCHQHGLTNKLHSDINLRISPKPTNTVQVTVRPGKPIDDPDGMAKDLQSGLADVIHAHRGWMHFVDVTLVEVDGAKWAHRDSSPYRKVKTTN